LPSPRHLVIHGHFYQPPRENPWSGSIAVQPSAAPYHDWNTRINRECYAPNAQARILDSIGRIDKISNNYAHISFNFGPTLLSWLNTYDKPTFVLISQADRAAAAAFGGHGSALAQVFNHIIMPLANSHDKLTQVLWGQSYFQHIFGRVPEGMWLAETAVDTETLGVLGRAGIKFTVLAQHQIDATRPLTAGRKAPWEPAVSADPRQPYRIWWGYGDKDYIDVFIYDGPVSRAVAFEQLLRDGRLLKNRIAEAFGAPYASGRPRLVNLATDGESYGHHFQFGDMALAWLLNNLMEGDTDPEPITLTTYGYFLEKYPPILEARLVGNSSWSCAHGVERWRSDCGCHINSRPGWNQKWRTPLRDGLNWLRDRLADIFETHASQLLKNPWEARNDYIRVLLSNFDPAVREDFLAQHAKKTLSAKEKLVAVTQLEAQRMSMYMFTSCGWFFDDLAGLEPVQNLRYAHKAIALAGSLSPTDLTEGLLAYLRLAKPNDPAYDNGEAVWYEMVVPEALSDGLTSAHWAAARLFGVNEALEDFVELNFSELEANLSQTQDGARLLSARLEITDLKLGQPGVIKNITAQTGPGGRQLVIDVTDDDSKETDGRFSLDTLWPSVRQKLLSDLVTDFFSDLRSYTHRSFNHYRELLVQYSLTTKPLDWLGKFVFRVVAETKVDAFLGPMKEGLPIDLTKLGNLLDDAEMGGSFQNESVLTLAAQSYISLLFSKAADKEARTTIIEEISDFIKLLKAKKLPIELWQYQNSWFALIQNQKTLAGLDPNGLKSLAALGEILGFNPACFLPKA
jgi:hypothetical protein